jgi:hypothetical protein
MPFPLRQGVPALEAVEARILAAATADLVRSADRSAPWRGEKLAKQIDDLVEADYKENI